MITSNLTNVYLIQRALDVTSGITPNETLVG